MPHHGNDDPPSLERARAGLREGLAFHQQSHLTEAIDCYRNVLRSNPQFTAARHMLGLALHQLGRSGEGIHELDVALRQTPNDPALLANRASVLLTLGRAEEAAAACRTALGTDPANFAALHNLGLALECLAQPKDAMAALVAALRLRPQSESAAKTLARLAIQSRDIESARMALPALEKVTDAAGLLLRGDLDELCGNINAAWRFWSAAATLDGSHAVDARIRIARTALHAGRPDLTVEQTEAVLASSAGHRVAMLLHAAALLESGKSHAAVAAYRKLMRVHPDFAEAESNYLIALQHLAETTPADILSAHRNWNRRHAPPADPIAPPPGPRTRPRIIWISPRFTDGPVRTFFASVLAALRERDDAEHILVMTGQLRDAVTDSFRTLANHWIDASSRSDEDLVAQLRSLDADAAVDLAGHTPGHRLCVLAKRVAPVQASWLDYFSTTGIPAIDLLLSDERLTPTGFETAFSERVVHLPLGRLCYSPPDLPAAKLALVNRREPLLVCFNRTSKISTEMLTAWARILSGLDGWRLRLRASGLRNPTVQATVRETFARNGINPRRIEMEPFGTYAGTLESYREAAIALDTYPYSGCASTCDALWMGVPVISMQGSTMVSRQSAALLGQCGLDQLIATDINEYVSITQNIAMNLKDLQGISTNLRDGFRHSLCNADAFSNTILSSIVKTQT